MGGVYGPRLWNLNLALNMKRVGAEPRVAIICGRRRMVDRLNNISPPSCRHRCGRDPHLAAMVKRERSPSPNISQPDLVTEGAVRYAPIPEKCRKGYPGFQTSRRLWAEEAKKRLREYNLEPVRVFIRSVVHCTLNVDFCHELSMVR